MVQDQLVDYISSQLKLNVSRDAIKTALTTAGWAAQDVDDTFKKVDGASAPASVAAKPAASAVSPMSSISAASAPHMIKMSDLVSGPKADAAKPAAVKPDAFGSFVASSSAMKTAEAKPSSSSSSASFTSSTLGVKPKKSKSAMIAESLEAIIIVALAIFAGYLYFNSQSLLSEIGSLKAASGSDTTSAADLTSQVNALTASTTALGTQVTSLTAETQELSTELSFYAVASGAGTSSVSSTFTGTLSLVGAKYWITMQYGAKAAIANSGNATFAAQLKPNVGQTVQISGTYVPGSDQVTMTALLSPAPAAPVASTTPAIAPTTPASSTTPAAAPMIPATTTASSTTSSSTPTP